MTTTAPASGALASDRTAPDVTTLDVAARLDAVAPGLAAALAGTTVADAEQDAAPVLDALRATRATAMLVPAALGGGGVAATRAVRFQVALGACAPSAAVATTMHHYKLAALGGVAADGDATAAGILRSVASRAALVASGGAESVPGRDLTSLGTRAVRDGDTYVVTGTKRPCSLSTSMDVLSLMAEVHDPDGTRVGHAQVFVEADAPGLTRTPFWRSPVLAAAQSHAVHLDAVRVPAAQVFALDGDTGGRFAVDCYAWFDVLVVAAYLGAAHALAAATPPHRRGTARWARAVAGLVRLEEQVVAAAATFDAGEDPRVRLNAALRARDAVEDELGAVGGALLQAAGGGLFATTGLYTSLAGALNAVAFHPPARGARHGLGLELLDPDVRDRE